MAMLKSFDDKEDKELLELFRKDGNNEWLGILLRRYTGMLLGVSLKYLKDENDARDSVQQIFLKVINELQKYRVEYFKSWLYMVAKNHCLMQLRNKHNRFTELHEGSAQAEESVTYQTALDKETTFNNLEKALTLLAPGQRECITLFYFRRKSYLEISDLTSMSVMQVKSNIQNGKRNLKLHLQSITHHE